MSGISNEPEIREWNKKNIKDYLEIYLKTDKKTLYGRDPKDIYKNYFKGEMNNVVGEDIKFNKPIAPCMTIDNDSDNNSKEIIDSNLFFIEEIGLNRFIGTQRSNGLKSMENKFKIFALSNI